MAIDDLLRNFPNRFIAGLMRLVVFPLGGTHAAPSDRLDHELARILQVPSATRSRIGRGQYLTPSEHNPVGLLEQALEDILAAEPVHKRLCDAMGKKLPFTRLDILAQKGLDAGHLSADDARILSRAEESRLRSINVDEFEPHELAAHQPKQEEASVKKDEAKPRHTEAA